MPLPPNPPDEPDEPPMPLLPLVLEPEDDPPTPPVPLLPLDPVLDEIPAPPRVPADVTPVLRLAVLEPLLGLDEMLLPDEALLTAADTASDFAVAASASSAAVEA